MSRASRDPTTHVTCQLCRRKFRAITCFHLRNIHEFEGEHSVLDYKAEFDLAYAMCGEVRQQISEAKVEFWDERGQHRTPDEVLTAIRKRHRDGKSLRGKNVPVWLYEVRRRLFGTWAKAVEAAGFDYEHVTGVRRWSREKVIEEIQKLAAEGVPLDATSIGRKYSYLHEAAVKLFPRSWGKALRAAGFDPDEHKKPKGVWDCQRAEDWIRNRAASKKSVLARDAPRALFDFIRRRLALRWTEFVEQITGVPYPGRKLRRDWTREKVLSEIRRLKAERNTLTYRAVASACGQAVIHQARKFFGSWDAACSAASDARNGRRK
jgi:hypothetical protein